MTGVGVDIVSVSRIAAALRRSNAFALRNFTEGERRYCLSSAASGERLAARFAAKEAVSKALATTLRPSEIEVVHDGRGAPAIKLHGRTLSEHPDANLMVSLSHEGDHAVAFCVAVRNEPEAWSG